MARKVVEWRVGEFVEAFAYCFFKLFEWSFWVKEKLSYFVFKLLVCYRK